jgi:hypothetical protein
MARRRRGSLSAAHSTVGAAGSFSGSISFITFGAVEREVETRRGGAVKSTGVWKAKGDGTACLEFEPNPASPGAKNSHSGHGERDGERIYLLDSRGQRTKESLPIAR